MRIKDIMSEDVISVSPDTSIQEIADLLTKHNISGVPVVDESNMVKGIVTRKDILHKDIQPKFPPMAEILGGVIYLGGVRHYNEELRKLVATTAEQIMTEKVVTAHLDDTIEEAAVLMVENDVNRIPVLDDERQLAGIVTRADIVKHMAEKRK